MRCFQYNVGVFWLLVSIALSCSPELPQQSSEKATQGLPKQKEQGSKITPTTPVQKYGDIRQSPLDEDETAIEEEAKRSQEIATKTFKSFEPQEKSELTDHFYKCESHLSHLHFKLEKKVDELKYTDAKFKKLSGDAEKNKIGKFEPYSALRLPNESMFISYLNKDGKVYFQKKSSEDSGWTDPVLLADFKGSPVLQLNDEQRVEVLVYKVSNGQVYTYTWKDSAFEPSGSGVASSREEFQAMQERAGVAAELGGLTQFSVSPKPPEEKKDGWWYAKEVATRVFMGALTFGTSELASHLNNVCELQDDKEYVGLKCEGLPPTLVDQVRDEVCK